MSEPKHDSRKEVAQFFENVGQLLFGIIKELYLGIRYNLIPWNLCFIAGVFVCIAYLRGWDRALFIHFWIGKLYPSSG